MTHTLNLDHQRRRAVLDVTSKVNITVPWDGENTATLRAVLRAGIRDNRTTVIAARHLASIIRWATTAQTRIDPRIPMRVDTTMTMTDPGYTEILLGGTYHSRQFLLSCRSWEDDERREMMLAATHPARGSASWTLPVAPDDTFEDHLYATGWGVFAPLIGGHNDALDHLPLLGTLQSRTTNPETAGRAAAENVPV